MGFVSLELIRPTTQVCQVWESVKGGIEEEAPETRLLQIWQAAHWFGAFGSPSRTGSRRGTEVGPAARARLLLRTLQACMTTQ